MYKLLVSAALLVSAVNAEYSGYDSSSGGSSYGGSEISGGSYQKSEDSGYKSYDAQPSYESQKKEEKSPSECANGGIVHDVLVGGEAGLVYTPSSVMANVGDVVRFHFLSKNHTVTQSTFDKPCVKMAGGMDSNFKPSKLAKLEAGKQEDKSLIWDVEVKDQKPSWWYCKQKTGTHCGKGMVFAINPTAEKSFQKFQMMAESQNGTADANQPPPPPPPPSEVSVSPPPSMQEGFNTGSGGACSCACFCGVSAFPPSSGLGVGMNGGYGGMAPAEWNKDSGSSYSPPPSSGGY